MKKQSIKTLKRKLDDVFSQYIRLRDSDEHGLITCYCCGKKIPIKESQNMHFIPRQHMSLRFSEINCHAGCIRCNYFLNGNIELYTLHMKKEYGNDIVERLTISRNQTSKISEFEYKSMIDHYKKEIEKLIIEKNIKI